MPEQGIAPEIIARTARCNLCNPSTKEVRARRALCVQRQSHHPTGPIIPHAHISQALRMCSDCDTLVSG